MNGPPRSLNAKLPGIDGPLEQVQPQWTSREHIPVRNDLLVAFEEDDGRTCHQVGNISIVQDFVLSLAIANSHCSLLKDDLEVSRLPNTDWPSKLFTAAYTRHSTRPNVLARITETSYEYKLYFVVWALHKDASCLFSLVPNL